MVSRLCEELKKTKHQENTVSNLKKKKTANGIEERLLKKKDKEEEKKYKGQQDGLEGKGSH